MNSADAVKHGIDRCEYLGYDMELIRPLLKCAFSLGYYNKWKEVQDNREKFRQYWDEEI